MSTRRGVRRRVCPAPSRIAAGALALAALLGAGLGGCATAANGDAVTDTPADTLRGEVAVVGADPLTRVVLRTDDRSITLEGPAVDQLRRVNGLTVRVDGSLRDDAMTVTSFRVRAVDGLPAADGVLVVEGDTAVLVRIAGEMGGEPQAWGVISG